MTTLTLAVFALTWLLIAARRFRLLPIGRPAGALLGAVLMVAIGALTPAEAYAALDHDTLALLTGMMLLAAYVERVGLFEFAGARALSLARTPVRLLIGVSLLSGIGSALFVNDTVCLFLTPLVVELCRRARLPMGPYLIALCTSANVGSAATLVGNPQNMIIGSLSGMGFTEFLAHAGPVAAVGLVLNTALLVLFYRRRLPVGFGALEPVAPERLAAALDPPRGGLPLVVLVLVGLFTAFLAGAHLGFSTLGAVLVLMLADRREPREAFERVDWPLLVFFASLFIVVDGVGHTGLLERTWDALGSHLDLSSASGVALFTGVSLVGSNVFSNVPMVLLTGPYVERLGDPQLAWVLLAFTTTVAGNLTLVGSVANLIVAERARDAYTLGFREYLRFGVPSTLLVLAVCTPLVVWLS